MENTSLTLHAATSNLPQWNNVYQYSVPLAVFGAVLTSLLPVFSIAGSALLVTVIMKFPQLRQIPSNILLASLALSDLLIGLLIQPLFAAFSWCTMTSSSSICKNLMDINATVGMYFASVLMFSSSLSVAVITIDRYICIVESLRYISIVTKTRVIRTVIISWLIGVVLPAIRLFPSLQGTVLRVFQFLLLSAMLCINIFCYLRIFFISQRHKRHILSQLQAVMQGPIEQDFKSAKTVFIVVGAVFLSYTPLIMIQFLLHFDPLQDEVKIIHPFSVTIFLLNSSLNPLIIFCRSRKLRRFLIKLFKREMNSFSSS